MATLWGADGRLAGSNSMQWWMNFSSGSKSCGSPAGSSGLRPTEVLVMLSAMIQGWQGRRERGGKQRGEGGEEGGGRRGHTS